MKLWLLYTPGNPVEFWGLFRHRKDVEVARDVEAENQRVSGGNYYPVEIEEFEFQPDARWSDG